MFDKNQNVNSEEHKIRIYWWVIIILIIVKYLATTGLPIWIRDENTADESLMVDLADSLIKGNYLGEYSQFTLVKGIGFPVFLMIANIIGISYMAAVQILYIVACVCFLNTLTKFVENRKIKIFAFAFVLFMPYTYSTSMMLVYRDNITISLSIIVISLLMNVFFYLECNIKRVLLNVFWVSLCWILLWNTREDTFWTIILYLVFLLICFVNIRKFQERVIYKVKRFLIILIPGIMVLLSVQMISLINLVNYGVYTENELNNSNYTKAVMLIMSIKPENDVDYVEITHDTLRELYNVSPSLNDISDVIENEYTYGNMSKVGYNTDNEEINADWITWVLRGAASSHGYYESAQTAEDYWGHVYSEIQDAVDDGKLETRRIMPNRSLIYWPNYRHDNVMRWLKAFGRMYFDSISYSGCNVEIMKTDANITRPCVRKYELVTGDYAVDEGEYLVDIAGWCFLKNDKANIFIEDNDGNVISQIILNNSDDIYNGFVEQYGEEYEFAKKSRFAVSLELPNIADVYLIVRDSNGNMVGKVSLENNLNQWWTDDCLYAFDNLNVEYNEDIMLDKAERRIYLLQGVSKVYSYINIVISILADAIYIYMTILLIKKKDEMLYKKWIFASAILGSEIINMLALSYISAFMFDSIEYLSTVYGLVTIFNMCMICYLFDYKKEKRR